VRYHLILLLSFPVALLVSTHGFGQQSEQDKLFDIEAQRASARQRFIAHQLDSAIVLSDQGAFEKADEKFKHVLKNLKSIPSDFTFHFGKNSYYLGKYKQSIDWLNKYIQLKGTSGQYSEAAVDWLAKAETALLKEREVQAKQAGEVLSRDYDIDCGASGKVLCPICSGTTVMVKKGYLNETYQTCPYCNRVGFLSCEDYNKLIRGQLRPVNN
jgi:tetratricopeptide (TPR) repeat protein